MHTHLCTCGHRWEHGDGCSNDVAAHTCEKCGAEQLSSDQFWHVGVIANTIDYDLAHAHNRYFVKDKIIEVCRPCLESFGIHVQQEEQATPPLSYPTIEELIRQIVEMVKE